MSLQSMLTDTCDIYHLKKEQSTSKFGIPQDKLQKKTSYPTRPNIAKVKCCIETEGQSINQQDPNNRLVQTFSLIFNPDVNVKVNDKVVWNGIDIILQVPVKIKNHHIEVTGIRDTSL